MMLKSLKRMISVKAFRPVVAALGCLLLVNAAAAQLDRQAVYEQMLDFRSLVKGGVVQPNWMKDGRSFWYVEGTGATRQFIKVDPAANSAEPMFDVPRLHAAIKTALGREVEGDGLPFDDVDSLAGNHLVGFTVDGVYLTLDLRSYEVTRSNPPSKPPMAQPAKPVVYEYGSRYVPAPAGDRAVIYKDYNLWLRRGEGGVETPLTTDGTARNHWSVRDFAWSPDGKRVLAEKVDWSGVHFTPIVNWLEANAEEISYSPYPVPGQHYGRNELHILEPESGHRLQIDVPVQYGDKLWPIGWGRDGSEVLFMRTDRLMKRLDLMAADPKTGSTRFLVTDRSETFIERIIPITDNLFYPLEKRGGFIWRSERDGWSHLYLYRWDGRLVRQLTRGPAPVHRIVAIDEARNWIYYLASGDQSRPYDVHLYRTNFEGHKAQQLTSATGIHNVSLSADYQYFIDQHSAVDRPPVTELRAANGTLIRTLAKADVSALEALNWRAPEEFKVKAADGTTDIYGVLYKPYDFDASKRYPVIDLAYPGTFSHQVPNSFVGTWLGDEAQALTQLGFIVCIVDGRGTAGRGKAFHDLAYRRVGEIAVPDHVAALRQLAADRPYMDLTRVGVTGYSWGGWFSIRALLTAPDFFKVGVAGAPVVELLGLESLLGLPEENPELWEATSNLPIAGNLTGKLLMTTNTSDPGASFGSAMRMVNAFIKAGKHFDLIVFPGEEHALRPAALAYYIEARNRYFVEHLAP
ncbi:MAG TPA: DPP IV N-terminal domain-containing protein [Steroidobacter sp.]